MAKAKQNEQTEKTRDEAALSKYLENAVVFTLFSYGTEPTLTVSEQIAARVAERIIQGKFEPGTPLREQDLADEFEVSRGPVREAIRILEREGLAVILPRRGAVVTELSIDEVREIFEIRTALFELVHRKVFNDRNPQLLAVLKAGVGLLETLSNLEDDAGKYAETSYRLSIIAVRACDNQRLIRMITSLSFQTLRYSRLSLRSKERRQQSAQVWREATDALERGDKPQYIKLVRRRIEESGTEAVRVLAETSQ